MRFAIFLVVLLQFLPQTWATPSCESSARKPEIAAASLLLSGLNEGPLKIEDLEKFLLSNVWTNPYANHRKTLDGLALFNGFTKLSRQMNAEQRKLVKENIRYALIQQKQSAEVILGARDNTKWVLGHPTIVESFEPPRGKAADFKILGERTRAAHIWIDGRPVFVETYLKAEQGNRHYFDVLFDPFHPDPAQRVFEIRSGTETPITTLKILEDDGRVLLIELGTPFAFDLKTRKTLSRAPFTEDEFEGFKVRDIFQVGSKTVIIKYNGKLILIDRNAEDEPSREYSGSPCDNHQFQTVGDRHFVTCIPMQRKPLYIFDIEAGEFLPTQQTPINEKQPPMFSENGKIYFAEYMMVPQQTFAFVQVNLYDRKERRIIAKTPVPKNEKIFEDGNGLHFLVEHTEGMTVGDLLGGPTFTIPTQKNNPIKKTFRWGDEAYGYRMDMFGKFEIQSLRTGQVVSRYQFEPLATSHYIFSYQGRLYGFFTQYNNPSLLMRLEMDTSQR